MSKGVPFEKAFDLPPDEHFAMTITFMEIESGKEWDWTRMRWLSD